MVVYAFNLSTQEVEALHHILYHYYIYAYGIHHIYIIYVYIHTYCTNMCLHICGYADIFGHVSVEADVEMDCSFPHLLRPSQMNQSLLP